MFSDKFIETTRSDFIGSVVGESGPKTIGTMTKAIEGVLFFDEAYQLTSCHATDDEGACVSFDSYGLESLAEFLTFLQDHRGQTVVILAGYKDKMESLILKANEGMSRRFPVKWDLIPYTADALWTIMTNQIYMTSQLDASTLFSNESIGFITHVFGQTIQQSSVAEPQSNSSATPTSDTDTAIPMVTEDIKSDDGVSESVRIVADAIIVAASALAQAQAKTKTKTPTAADDNSVPEPVMQKMAGDTENLAAIFSLYATSRNVSMIPDCVVQRLVRGYLFDAYGVILGDGSIPTCKTTLK